jgi:class 3 adenylate cyclase/tetratricopeptide (TPR) repeat protein
MLTAMLCVSCGAQIPGAARFCPSCGHRVDGRADERRIVTVLFADMVGFTSLSETRDPEEIKGLVDRCFQLMVAEIVGFGGRVDKIIGDAIVALFGAPEAHEDDAERAVRAALRMQETLHSRQADLDHLVRMRVGVNTGEVLVGALQAGGDYTAMGDVVNTAARLQTSAGPGEVLVGPATWNATRRTIAYQPRGLLSAKGREAPIDTFVATGALAAPGDRSDRPDVPLVGRTSELALLAQATNAAMCRRRATLVLIAGDAGMGKSRLAHELTESLVERHGAVAFHGRCVPYGEANVWWPVAEALRTGASISPDEDLDTAREKLTNLVATRTHFPAGSPDAARLVPGLLQFLGVDHTGREVDPNRVRDEAVGALLAYLEAATDHQPVVVQLSDLHWADDAVLDLGAALLDRLSRRPFTLVTSARGSLLDRWRPPAGRFDTIVVNLEPLDREASAALLRSLVDDRSQLTPEVEDALIDRGGGNPFFLEELVTLVKERGGAPTVATPYGGPLAELPDTLRGLLTARLDRLAPAERVLIEDAAVLGRRGRVEWLEIMSSKVRGTADIDGSLDELVRRDLLVLEGPVWSFRSDLLREVAYHTLPKLDRARRHLGIAAWLEHKHEGDWSDGQVDQIAHHYGLAAELSNEVGGLPEFTDDMVDRALLWLEKASARAEQLRTLPVAARLYDEALTLAGNRDPAVRFRLLLGRARVSAERRELDAARVDIGEARRMAEEMGEADGEAAALLVEGDIEAKDGDVDAAVALLDRAVARYEAAGDEHGRADALRTRAMAELFGGRYSDAERSALAALEGYESLGDERQAAWSAQTLGWITFVTGRIDAAASWLDRAVATFVRLGDSGGQAWAEGLLAYVRFQEGRSLEARELQTRVLAEARVGGDRWACGMMLLLGGLMSLWLGDTHAAIEQSAEARGQFTEVQDRFGFVRSSWTHGRALVMSGRVSEGLDVLGDAAEEAAALAGTDEGLLAGVALAGTLVQIGDPRCAFSALGIDPDGAELSLDHHEESSVQTDRLVIGGLAALQSGQPERAVEWFAEALDRGVRTLAASGGGGPAPERVDASDDFDLCRTDANITSAYALGLACAGRFDEARTMASAAIEAERGTYLDRLTAQLATALSELRSGDPDAAMRALATASTEVDGTGDRVAQALLRMAAGRIRAAAGRPDDGHDALEAITAFESMGVDPYGWRRVIDDTLRDAAAPAPA